MNGTESPQSKRRACARCAIAKAKCSYSGGLKVCDRCRRLRRDCIVEEAPRCKKKKEKHSTRVKALEDKVNSILTLLSPENVVGNATAIANNITTPAPTEEDNVTIPSLVHLQSAKSTESLAIEERRQFDVIDSGLLTISMANALLNNYKQLYSKFFPFVLVTPEIDAATLRKDSPFLFLAIMATCIEGDHILQRRLGVEMKKILCERVLVTDERSMDLLQGVLVRLGWDHFHFNPMKRHSNMLLHIAIGLVRDLNLDRCPEHREQRVGSNLCFAPTKFNQGGNFPSQCRRTAAETRAFLGCFYLSSSTAMMRKELAMEHTKWIDHCCHVLDVEQESATDLQVIAFVKARCLAQRISQRFSYDDPPMIRFPSDTMIQMSLNGFKKEFAELEASPGFSAVHENHALMTELKVLPITMHEVALYRDQTTTPQISLNSSHLWELLVSTRDFLTYLLSIPSETVRRLPSMTPTVLSHALIILSTVSRLPSTTDWDSTIVKQEADVMNIAQRLREKFGDELTKTGQNVTTELKDVFAYFTRGIGGIMAWHQMCEVQNEGVAEYEPPISSSTVDLPLRCALADTTPSFSALRVKLSFLCNGGVENGTQMQPSADVASAYSGTRLDALPDLLTNTWDDGVWQSLMDEFSTFPTLAALPSA